MEVQLKEVQLKEKQLKEKQFMIRYRIFLAVLLIAVLAGGFGYCWLHQDSKKDFEDATLVSADCGQVGQL